MRYRTPKFIFFSLFYLSLTTTLLAKKTPPEEFILEGENSIFRLKKSFLGEPFILHRATRDKKIAPMFSSKRSKLVYFELKQKVLELRENPKRQSVLQKQAPFLIASFPLVKTDEQSIYFEMKEFLKDISILSEMYTSDFQGRNFNENDFYLRASNISTDSVSFSKKTGILTIQQSAVLTEEITIPIRSTVLNSIPLDLIFYLSPLKKEKSTFKEKESKRDKLWFFETAPQLDKTGRSSSNITKWELKDKKKITYHLSNNTPKEFHEAIKKGVLYWNKAFDKEILEVKLAPKKVQAPHSDYNLIQWVEWLRAGFAYADWMQNPQTGEILHAQIFMTDSWAFTAKYQIRRILRNLETEEQTEEQTEERKKINRKHSHHSKGCHCRYNLPQGFKETMTEALTEADINDESILRISQNYITMVIAHEVGHTLGLRHNFAGHLSNSLQPKEVDELFTKYLKNSLDPQDIPQELLSSIMHYPSFKVDILVGYAISQGSLLVHDKRAIKWGYFAQEEENSEVLYTTDSGNYIYDDVGPFKQSKNPFVDAFHLLTERVRLVPSFIIETYIAAKAPMSPEEALPVKDVSLNPHSWANRTAQASLKLLELFDYQTRILQVESKYKGVLKLEEEEINDKKFLWLAKQIKEAGGLDKLLFSLYKNTGLFNFSPIVSKSGEEKMTLSELFSPRKEEKEEQEKPFDLSLPELWPQFLIKRLDKLLQEDHMKEFIGLDGNTHTFSDEELQIIRERGKTFIIKFCNHLFEKNLSQLSKQSFASLIPMENEDSNHLDLVEKRFLELADTVLMSRDKSKELKGHIQIDVNKNPQIIVNEPLFSNSLRKKTAELLHSHDVYTEWCNSDLLREQFNKNITLTLGADPKDIKLEMLSPQLRFWFLEEREIFQKL